MTKKLLLAWKDPDWAAELSKQMGGRDIPDELWDQLHALGLDEYIDVEVDTEANTAIIVRPTEL